MLASISNVDDLIAFESLNILEFNHTLNDTQSSFPQHLFGGSIYFFN